MVKLDDFVLRVRTPPRRRTDREVIGAVHMLWDGTPLMLSDLAALIDEPDLELRVGLLAPWVEAIIIDAGPLLYARTCGSDEVRSAVLRWSPLTKTETVWMEEEAA